MSVTGGVSSAAGGLRGRRRLRRRGVRLAGQRLLHGRADVALYIHAHGDVRRRLAAVGDGLGDDGGARVALVRFAPVQTNGYYGDMEGHVTAVNALIVDLANTKQVLNALIDALQASPPVIT